MKFLNLLFFSVFWVYFPLFVGMVLILFLDPTNFEFDSKLAIMFYCGFFSGAGALYFNPRQSKKEVIT